MSQDSSQCDFDEDCEEGITNDDEDAYVVCTDRRCEFVCWKMRLCGKKYIQGENMKCFCVLQGGQCKGNFCLFKKREETSFRRKCQEENNCEELDNCHL